jgi:hypothetical protein
MYVLEHGYRWLIHLDSSFWSAPFFYPASNVIAYSDNHLGSLLFYSALRSFGASRETAFQLWVFIVFALNYFITWLVLKKQNLHPIGAIVGAYLFTFPMIVAAQMIHMPLMARFMVPVAFWMAYEFLESGKPRFLCLLFAACAYQIYLGIYIGYLLILSLVPFCAALFLYRKQWFKIRSFIANRGTWVVLRQSIGYVGSCIVFVVVLIPLIVPYYRAQQEMGHRTWDEVVLWLPRWQSYLYAAPGSILGKILHFGDSLPCPWEHQLFLGFLPYIGILIFLYLFLKGKMAAQERLLGLGMMSVLITLSVLTFYFHGFSLYRYVWAYVPGAGGIRCVTRIVLVLIYPIAFICGAIVTYLMNSRPIARASWMTGILAMGLLTLVVDQAAGVASISKRECKRRIASMKAEIAELRGNNLNRRVLWVNRETDEPNESPESVGVLVRKNSPIQDFGGLRGKTIAFAKGSSSDHLVTQLLTCAGMTFNDIKPVYLQPPDARTAFESGTIDAWAIGDPFLAAVEVRGDGWVIATGAGYKRNREHSITFFNAHHLDAMLAGQDLGLNVVNGYSGFKPNGYPQAMYVQTGDCCVELDLWAGLHPGTITNNSLIQVRSHCDIPK